MLNGLGVCSTAMPHVHMSTTVNTHADAHMYMYARITSTRTQVIKGWDQGLVGMQVLRTHARLHARGHQHGPQSQP